MAIGEGKLLEITDIKDLKAKVKAEMKRRQWGSGPLTSYGEPSWDFSVEPSNTSGVLYEHAQKIIEPLNAITNQGYTYDKVTPIKSMAVQLARVTSYATQGQYDTSSCAANCSGLCQGCAGCTSCTGCTGCGACGGCGGCSTCTSCSGCSGCEGCTSGCGSSCTSSGGPGYC